MDSEVTSESAPAGKADDVTVEQGPPGTAVEKAPATGGKAPRKPNWLLVALIAVSCVALLLLAATVTLAVTEGHHACHERMERFGEGRMCPMGGPGERPWRDRLPVPPQSSATQNQQAPPTQTPPATPAPQAQPPAGQGP